MIRNMLWSLLLLVPGVSIAGKAAFLSSSLSSFISTLSAGPIGENAGLLLNIHYLT